MDDKMIMENLLNTTKGVCDLYMHGAIESSCTSRCSKRAGTPPSRPRRSARSR